MICTHNGIEYDLTNDDQFKAWVKVFTGELE